MQRFLTAYQHLVVDKYHEYNELFLKLPFLGIPDIGRELPQFSAFCKDSLTKKISPLDIINQYFTDIPDDKKIDKLFLFLQFIERQIVLFDALEECAFGVTHDLNDEGHISPAIKNSIPADYKIRVVLTAHPTQFYTPYVLNIIQDLSAAIKKEDIGTIEKLLLQMGETPFLSKKRPSPLDEANFLIHYLSNIFYPVITKINDDIYQLTNKFTNAIQLGFWPGGDRDGNPNVTAEITLDVARELKKALIKCYAEDISSLERRLTFYHTLDIVSDIKSKLDIYKSSQEMLDDLLILKKNIEEEHHGLFIEYVDNLISSVTSFGFYFASLDLRQNSHVHSEFISRYISEYDIATNEEKILLLENALDTEIIHMDQQNDCIASLKIIPTIQDENGERGLNRYIISNTHSSANVIEVLLLNKWAGNDLNNLKLDIIPLFESIDDLTNAENIMSILYQNETYKKHLFNRDNTQTIMLGFSDGTKDGGYITANWSIYQTKKTLSALSRKYGITVIFFDGRGGPPSRGGGKTHLYYRSHEKDIAQNQIQLTIQGQTISSNFGTPLSAQYNLEQLFTAGLQDPEKKFSFSDYQVSLINQLSQISGEKYHELKNHPQFFNYLTEATPLNFYGELNIASRPPRRGKSDILTLDDLRAIPFVGAWTLMKQNVPGYFGVGTGLSILIDKGNEQELKTLYQQSLYFKSLVDNAMQSLKKAYFPLTQYLSDHPDFGGLWNILHTEAELTKSMLLKISGCKELLDNDPVTAMSIQLREDIVLPLQVIQQYALIHFQTQQQHSEVMKKLIMKSMATNINAGRNSV